MKKKRKADTRPICTCGAYSFPHKIGGNCNGSAFAEHYFYWVGEHCLTCNCNVNGSCEVVDGIESIHHGECLAFNQDYYLKIEEELS